MRSGMEKERQDHEGSEEVHLGTGHRRRLSGAEGAYVDMHAVARTSAHTGKTRARYEWTRKHAHVRVCTHSFLTGGMGGVSSQYTAVAERGAG